MTTDDPLIETIADAIVDADTIDHLIDKLPDHLPPPWRADGPSRSTGSQP